MRPVARGPHPQDADGRDVHYRTYAQARRELIQRLGEYCSYCEMHQDASLAVEHVRPKKPPDDVAVDQTRELDWNNFLLSCPNCNSTKGNTDVVMNDYLWPDRDNTFQALKYSEGGLVCPADGLNADIASKAERIIELVGLDKTPNDDKASDRRWLNRKEAWDIAVQKRAELAHVDNDDFRDVFRTAIINICQAKGYWSIWMTVFKDDADMLRRLILAFPGTCTDCFNGNAGYCPTARPGGQC